MHREALGCGDLRGRGRRSARLASMESKVVHEVGGMRLEGDGVQHEAAGGRGASADMARVRVAMVGQNVRAHATLRHIEGPDQAITICHLGAVLD